MSNKTVIISVIVFAVVVLGGVGIYIKSTRSTPPQTTQSSTNSLPTPPESQVIPTLSPGDIGLTLTIGQTGKFAGHSVVVTVAKLDGISSIDCELSYTAAGNLPRGAICKTVNVKPGDTQETQELPFGTCSDVCHFDNGVSNVKMVFKITKSDGKVYQTQSTLSL